MPAKSDVSGHLTRELTDAQLTAIDRLVTGATDDEAAEAAGVALRTVNKWRTHDPVFVAALNARRRDLWAGSVDKLRALLPEALKTLEGALTVSRDWKAAVQVIQLAGLDRQGKGIPNLGPYVIGPTDPLAVVDDEVRQRRRGDDTLADLLDGGSITDRERLAVLKDCEDPTT
jgi:hypothetical protein